MDKNILNFGKMTAEKSTESVIRFALYSQTDRFFQTDEVYDTAYCSACDERLPVLLNGSGIYQCVFDGSVDSLPDGVFFLRGNGADERVLACKSDSLDDCSGDFFNRLCESLTDFPVVTAKKENVPELTEAEKQLLDAEKYDAAAAALFAVPSHTAEIKAEWKNFMENGVISDAVRLIADTARRAVGGKTDFIRLSKKNIALDAFKMCEDGSGDIVIRVHETDGAEDTHCFIMGDIYDMGFRFDIGAYEIKTFRINADGMVREVGFPEGILPFHGLD